MQQAVNLPSVADPRVTTTKRISAATTMWFRGTAAQMLNAAAQQVITTRTVSAVVGRWCRGLEKGGQDAVEHKAIV